MSAFMQLLNIVLIILFVIFLLAIRRRVLAKMALRNIIRRKKYSAIVIVGLLIATAMISASLVVGDTLDYVIKSDVFESTGDVDIVLTIDDDTGIHQFFDESVAYELIGDVENGSLEHVDEVAPSIREVSSVLHPETGASAPSAYIYAYDPDHMVNGLSDTEGNAISRDLLVGGSAVVNEDLADGLEVDVGDTVTVYPKNGFPVHLQISAIAADEGMGNWRFSEVVFVDLAYAQDVIFQRPSMITTIDVSCAGSMEDGYKVTDEAVAELKANLPDPDDFTIDEVKRDGVEEAESVADAISQLFVLMSSFTIIAGVALIVNIFVMLAEERKSEMGISRAIGMQRRDLTQTFVFEGVVYALAAAAIGAFVGLVIAFIMIIAFSGIVGGGIAFVLHFEWSSLALAAVLGFLITMLTVVAASWRVSKLNIVRAIRDIPEPVLAKSERKYLISGIAAIVLGGLLLCAGAASRQAVGTSSGMALIALGAAIVAVRFVNPRVPFTVAGFWMVFYSLDPLGMEVLLFGQLEGNLEMFIVGGVVMVTGGVLMAMFNSDLMLEGLVRVFGRGRSLLPVFRAAVSYPLNKKFRTGLTVFIFALIMFTVVVIAMNASFQRESVDTLSERFSGGFEIVGYSLREVPQENLTAAVDLVHGELLGVEAIGRIEAVRTALVTLEVEGVNDPVRRNLIGLSHQMLSDGDFSLAERAEEYASDDEAWRALSEDHNLTILDGTVIAVDVGVGFGNWYAGVGDVVTTTFSDGSTVNLTVIGIMDQMLVAGAFTSEEFVMANAAVSSKNLFYVDTVPSSGLADDEVKEALEKALAEYGLTAIVIKDIVEEVMSMSSSIMQLMEVFLGVGLIVGIAGLGIITIRNISERRQEIGVMRAIGFQKNMILGTFLIETSFVSLLGIVMGIVLGLLISYRLFDWAGFSEYSRFVIPWGEVLLVLTIAFVITIMSTLPPSRSAARLAPAEALRRVD
jgi:putative ABC transport system permease protein